MASHQSFQGIGHMKKIASVFQPNNIEGLIEEYQILLEDTQMAKHTHGEIDWDKLSQLLGEAGGWTEKGASHIVQLAREYGTFVLRNALAISIALRYDDGELNL